MANKLNYFEEDNFAARRSGAGENNYGNAYDPESLITGGEVAAGLTYEDKRVFPDEETYRRAVAGEIRPEDIPGVAPRVRKVPIRSERLERLLEIYHAPMIEDIFRGMKGAGETIRIGWKEE